MYARSREPPPRGDELKRIVDGSQWLQISKDAKIFLNNPSSIWSILRSIGYLKVLMPVLKIILVELVPFSLSHPTSGYLSIFVGREKYTSVVVSHLSNTRINTVIKRNNQFLTTPSIEPNIFPVEQIRNRFYNTNFPSYFIFFSTLYPII